MHGYGKNVSAVCSKPYSKYEHPKISSIQSEEERKEKKKKEEDML